MKTRPRSNWAWRPPVEPDDPGRVVTGTAAHLAARQMHDDEPEGPPDEELWAQTFGQRFAELIRDLD